MEISNFFNHEKLPTGEEEIFNTLCNSSTVKIEKIISKGQVTPEGIWYDSDRTEWVMLMQGKASLLFDNNKSVHLKTGDYLLIPAGLKHRVTYTSTEPVCLWIAVHFQNE